MTGRERFLAAINNKKADRLPCQIHEWMKYYLNKYLSGMDQYQAYDYLGMDPVAYVGPDFIYNPKDLRKWDVKNIDVGNELDGNHRWKRIITTPEGTLTESWASNKYTTWIIEHPIKSQNDFELWNKYIPVPEKVDWTPVIEAKKRIGDKGIVRAGFYDFGQGSPWQSFVGYLYPVEKAILMTYDEPEWIHYVLDSMLEKKLKVIERTGNIELDLVETGGGAGSSTVISPNLHREFCLPYDIKQHKALHAAGTKVVYHLCGGLMPLLEIIAENGTDGLETMTPTGMGGDCDLAEATRRVGNKLFFIGGFDQNAGFENGNPNTVRDMVYNLFKACPDGGYICSPSDHFFFGDPENIKAFVEAAKECVY
ncbi:MAG TPA: uroporphyrinogen decarboxylase family protein [Ruminiclostridium sp.]